MKKLDDALEILNKVENLESQEDLINLKKEIFLKKEDIDYNVKSKFYHYLDYKSFTKFKSFFDWLDKNLVLYKKLELKYFSDDHRGIISKSKIKVFKMLILERRNRVARSIQYVNYTRNGKGKSIWYEDGGR